MVAAGPDRPARARRWSTARFTSNVDMRTGSPAFGTPEYVKARSPPASWPGATGCRGGRRTRRPRTSSTPRPRTRAQMAIWGAVMGGRQPALPGRRLARGRADRVVREADPRRRDAPDDRRGPRTRRGRRGDARPRRDRRGRAGRPLLRHRAHARALRDRVLPADAVRLAHLRDLAGGRRPDGDGAREHDLEAAARRVRAAGDAARPRRGPRRLHRAPQAGDHRTQSGPDPRVLLGDLSHGQGPARHSVGTGRLRHSSGAPQSPLGGGVSWRSQHEARV